MKTRIVAFSIILTAIALSGCNMQQSQPVPTQQTTGDQQASVTITPPSQTPPGDTLPLTGSTGGKKIACMSDADCVPDPMICHPHACVTKTEAAGEKGPEICTMMFDVQAAYSPEDCTCDLGICKDKNIGRTSPDVAQPQ